MKKRSLSYLVYSKSKYIRFVIWKINILYALYWKVKIGPGAKFIGRTYFRRYPGTQIIIGKGNMFLSKNNSNFIGINRPCIFSTHESSFDAKIEIGDNCGFSGTVIGAFKYIKLGDNVRCGANTLITDSNWHLDDYRSSEPREIEIKDNVWLGANSVVFKGVTIGENSFIGANSVVVKSIPANVIATGNPCKVIRPNTAEKK